MKIIKYALILGSLLASGSAVAQTAVLPTAPTPPTIVTTSPNENEADALQTTNMVYINQAGTSVNVNIQQTGTADIIGGLSSPVYLRGDNQSLIVIQTGNTNTLQLGIVGGTGTGSGTSAAIQQLGDNNLANIQCGMAQGSPSCNGLSLNAKLNGSNNTFFLVGSAANITSTTDMEGDSNSTTINVSAPNSSQTLLFTGDENNINVTQTGAAGIYGHSLLVNMTGSNNTVTTQQYGPTETVVNIQSTGSNGSFTVKTGH